MFLQLIVIPTNCLMVKFQMASLFATHVTIDFVSILDIYGLAQQKKTQKIWLKKADGGLEKGQRNELEPKLYPV